MKELGRPCCIWGYHVYSAVWEAAILLFFVHLFSISSFAIAITFGGSIADKDPLGSGSLSLGLKKFKINIFVKRMQLELTIIRTYTCYNTGNIVCFDNS